jgi:DNA helicase-2/ATP-dependent DNA helicase PcrA
VVNFPTRGIGARTVEQLQDAAKRQRPQPGAERGRRAGKAGSNLQAFVALVDACARPPRA